jgi:EmrB/QacA subfamily drug resistance transporter
MLADELSAPEGVRFDKASGRWVLFATVLGSSMAMLDGTVVNLALRRMGEDLDASFAGLQWIINGYTLSLASLILVGGSLGDRFGRRRLFVVGTAWFTLASIACAVAPNVPLLVAGRVLQGIGGALLTPGSLAIIQASFDPRDRARAIGAWSGLGGVATGVGPFLGGWLVDLATWRSIFLINVPMGVAVIAIAIWHVPETRDDTSAGGRLDVPGAVLGVAALAAITYGITEQELPIVAGGVAALVAFVVTELRVHSPMLPMGVFRSKQFSGTNVVTFLLYGALAVSLFLLGLVLQSSLGYSPLLAGAATTPITVLMLLLSARSGALAERIGPRLPMSIGPLVCAAGLALLTRVADGRPYVAGVLPGILVFGAGLTITVAPLTTTALGAVESRLAGVASGVNNAVARTGQLVAVAAVPLLAGFVPGDELGGAELLDGFHRLLWIASAVTAASGVLAYATIRNPARPARPAPTSPSIYHCSTCSPPVPREMADAART